MGLNRPQRPAVGNLHDALPNLVRPRVATTKPVHDHTTTKGRSGPLFRSRGVRMTAHTQPILNDAPTLVLFKRDEAGKAYAPERVAPWLGGPGPCETTMCWDSRSSSISSRK
jgi:hypothetical protein